jgi:hypothetical protein
VIYIFTVLMIHYLGGENDVICDFLAKRKLDMPWPFQKLPPIILDDRFYKRLKQGTLQFVYIKPVLALISLLLEGYGVSTVNDYSLRSAGFYLSLVSNTSVTISLYCLVLLFQTCRESLESAGFIQKFMCVKLLIFCTYWQACVLNALEQSQYLPSSTVANSHVLLCIEYLVAAYAFWKAFTFKEFTSRGGHAKKILKGVGGLISIKDIVTDTRKAFSKDEEGLTYSSHQELWQCQ